MNLCSLVSISLLSVAASHAIALPAVHSAAEVIHIRHDNHRHQAGLARCAAASESEFWLESIAHQGVSPLGPSGYTVFRNVRDFGAKGK
jgi:glucan 1,3-beta-glucosidase